jgi:hypothetical protein
MTYYLDAKDSYLEEDWLLDKIFQAFFVTLFDEDIEAQTSNQYEGVGVPSTFFLITKRILGLPHRTHEKERAYLEEEFLDKKKQKYFTLDYPFIFGIINYVFLGGIIIEPLKALWQIAFEFPIRAIEVTLLHIREHLNPDGITNKILYGIEQFIALPRLLSRAILRPMKSYYLVGTAFEDRPRLKKAAQITSAIVSITAAVAICVALPFFIHTIAPTVAPLVAHIAPQLGQAITFLGSTLGAALTIGITTTQATFNALLPMSIMLFKKKKNPPTNEFTELLIPQDTNRQTMQPRLAILDSVRVLTPSPEITVSPHITPPSTNPEQRDRNAISALPQQSIATTRKSSITVPTDDEDIQASKVVLHY